MRVESSNVKKFKDGQQGWIHQLEEDWKPLPKPEKKAKKVADVWALAKSMAAHSEADRKRQEVAAHLGVSLSVVESMMVGVWWDPWNAREVATFPGWDAAGKVRGIIMRYSSGKKLTVPGTSNSGVFLCPYWWLKPGAVFIVEGASDVLALASVNLAAIGRPSNVGGADIIATMLKLRVPVNRPVIVVVELDQKEHHELSDKVKGRHDPNCRGCLLCWPGLYGAEVTCEQIKKAGMKSVRWVVPSSGCKDGREMVNSRRIEAWLEAERIDSFYCPEMDIP